MTAVGVTNPRMAELATLRTDVVGSLLRPQRLKDAFAGYAGGTIDERARIAVEDEEIVQVIAQQQAHNVPVLTDGEFRRVGYMDSFSDVAGMSSWRDAWQAQLGALRDTRPDASGGEHGTDPTLTARQAVTRRLQLERNRPLDEYRFVAARADRPASVTVLGPDRVLQAVDIDASRQVYADLDEVAGDVVAVLRQMVGELVDAGCGYVHIDEPGFTSYVDEHTLAGIRARGADPAEDLTRSIRAGNALFDSFDGVVFGVHVCRGNRQSMWHREGHYDAIAEQLFSELRCTRWLLEYDTERAGGFAPLRFVRPGAVAVLGLISTKTPRLEPVDELLRRIDDAARYLPVDQLALSPQCGFASVIEGNRLTIDDQWRKLDLMHEVAARVWG